MNTGTEIADPKKRRSRLVIWLAIAGGILVLAALLIGLVPQTYTSYMATYTTQCGSIWMPAGECTGLGYFVALKPVSILLLILGLSLGVAAAVMARIGRQEPDNLREVEPPLGQRGNLGPES